MKRIRLAIVDDSSFVRKALVRMLRAERRIDVVGAAATGEELFQNLQGWRPDVLTLDLEMPGMGGLATLDRLRIERPIPVVIFSTHSEAATSLVVEALSRSAVDFVDKTHVSPMDFSQLREQLVQKILHLVGAEEAHATPRAALVADAPAGAAHPARRPRPTAVDALLIGASTGGPSAIQTILEGLGGPVPVPILIVQHMPHGFTAAFARRLNGRLPFPVSEAADGDAIRPGAAYIAPAGAHLKLRRRGDGVVAVLDRAAPPVSHCPSVDVLFHSACAIYGGRVVALLLSGMGSDGADGLAALARGGAYTIGQSERTCVVYGMPKVAWSLGAVTEELDLTDIGPRVADLLGGSASGE